MRPQVFIIALIIMLGGLAVGIFISHSSGKPVVTTEPEHKAPATYDVWIAAHALKRGQSVGRNDLSLTTLTDSQAKQKGIRESSTLSFVKGMAANKAIEAGQVVFPDMVTSPDQDGYFSLLIKPGQVPFPLIVSSTSVLAGVIQPGTYVDVLALSSRNQNLADAESVRDFKSMTVTPVLMGVRVLQVQRSSTTSMEPSDKANLILSLTRKQASTALIARKMAELEVQVSNGDTPSWELTADAGDVVSSYRAIKEFRAETSTVQ